MRVIGLPGNPVSSYVCAFLFLVPLIRALSGRSAVHHARETALLGRDVGANDMREDYLRARLERRGDGALIAIPVDHQDSSLLGKSRCGTGISDPSAIRAEGAGRFGLRHSAAARLTPRGRPPQQTRISLTGN